MDVRKDKISVSCPSQYMPHLWCRPMKFDCLTNEPFRRLLKFHLILPTNSLVVFVDAAESLRFHPAQNQKIEVFLARFPLRT